MAKKSARRSPRNTGTGSNAMAVQKTINRDYKTLVKDYEKLGLELWRKPVTKYILGGVALTALYPVAMRIFNRYPEINTFFRNRLELIEERLEAIGEKIGDTIDRVKSDDSDTDLSDARH